MPNWNSWTMPVTTPRAKLIRNSLPRNLLIRSHSGSFLTSHRVSVSATSALSPMVSGTNRKW